MVEYFVEKGGYFLGIGQDLVEDGLAVSIRLGIGSGMRMSRDGSEFG